MARGDQIYVYREFINIHGVYQHHGIDCGDGTVIHYRKGTETIERNPIEYLTDGRRVYLKKYPVRYIAETTIKRAESRLGEHKYNLLFNNCEHFATWCVTGVSHSQQVINFLPLLKQVRVDELYQPVKRAINEAKPEDTTQLLNQALAEIKVAWDNIHPQYKQALKEMNDWEKVAFLALQKNREDLAREALFKKRNYKEKVESLEEELNKIAIMTENLLKTQKDLMGNGEDKAKNAFYPTIVFCLLLLA